MRRALWAAALAALALPLWGQDPAAGTDDKKLTFKFKDASVDAVLAYVSQVTGWIFVQERTTSSTITAVSDTEVPASRCLDFLNAALRSAGLVVLNPYSPSLPKPGQTLKVLDVSKAMQRGIEIYTGSDPDTIPITDQVRTQILPLKAVNVIDVNKELGDVLKGAVGDSGTMAISTYSNSVLLTGRSEGINRAARILRVIDVSASAELKVRVFPLRNADATETAKTLNEVFKRETMRGETGQQNPMQNFWRMMGGGGRGGGEGGSGPSARALAHEMVRITAEGRTNSLIVSATEDNMKIIEDLVLKLDDKSAAAIKLKLYPLRYADATAVAKLINDLFAETATNSNASRNPQGGGGGGRGMLPVWMGGGQPQAASSTQGATSEVRAVTDIRTNSVLVGASEQKLALIDAVMLEIDRQVNDLLEVKIYKLQNADPVQLATVLQSLFRPQVNATANAGRTTGGQVQGGQGLRIAGGNAGTSGGLLPSQEVEITSDTRTRAVVVKASKDYIAVMDEVVRQLDSDPTEAVSTYVVPLRNADATSLAQTLQQLLRSSQTGSQTGLNNLNRTGQQAQGFFGAAQNQSQNRNTGTSTRSSGGGGSSTRTRGGFLGPLEADAQEGPAPAPAGVDEDPRRGIEGQADIQADPTTNSLVIRTSPRNYQSIQGILQDLDRMRPQVLIKVLIADVTLDERTQFGVEGFWENKMTVRGGDKAVQRVGTDFALATSGFSYLLTGDEFQGTLNVFAAEGKLRVLATPRILVLDNQTANINVGKEVPRVTNTQVNQLGNTVNIVEYENIGIILDVTPHINPDGLVTMVVTPEISDVGSEAEAVEITAGVKSPVFTVNRASTSVAVRNGTTIVIGGLIRDSVDDAVQKIPLLGDIPLIGTLFSNTSKRKVKRELMIFLTPYVAFTAGELEEITQLEKSRLKIMDLRDIESESDRWLERIRRSEGGAR
jgi:general secretion pathway protein D